LEPIHYYHQYYWHYCCWIKFRITYCIMSTEDLSPVPPAMRKPALVRNTPSCHWLASTWPQIREEVNALLGAVEVTMQNRILPADVLTNVMDKRRALELAMRRRHRLVDEIWRCFVTLQRAHEDVLNDNLVVGVLRAGKVCRDTRSSPSVRFASPLSSDQSAIGPRHAISHTMGSEGDAPYPFRTLPSETRSCLEMLSTTLIRCGKELDIYDEESQSINRVAGVGLGLAMFVAVCTVVYYS